MNELPTIEVPRDPNRSTQNAVSPFRYPGGKGFLSALLKSRVNCLDQNKARFFAEPFCGGAGAALILLADDAVDRLLLNDGDIRIYSAWKAMIDEPDRFKMRIRSSNLDMPEWFKHRERVANTNHITYNFELGFSTFYMNRTTRSGIVLNSGPIGGYEQSGQWKIDARFNKDRICAQVDWLAERKSSILLSNLDALNFIDKTSRNDGQDNTFFFIDPPYVKAGGRLYHNGMDEAKHVALSDILAGNRIKRWLVTYDDTPIVRNLYKDQKCALISVNYSLQAKRKEREIMIEPAN